jgi:oligosaccharide reducing-end xylanase
MNWRLAAAARFSLSLLWLQGCGTTVDAVGYNGDGSPADAHLRPLRGPSTYPNAFRDVLGKTEAEITTRINVTFNQLFHGNLLSEAVYFEDGDKAYVRDILHGDIRTEGMGFGMIITVELDRRQEFDALFRYAKEELQFTSGPNRGYFRSRCDLLNGGTAECLDPYGLQHLVMALIFAHGRWGSDSGEIDYEAEALALFDVMRNKEAQNGGIVEGVTNTFDANTKLVFDFPNESAAGFTRPVVEMPAYYELWAQATGDSFYAGAAVAARDYWKLVANQETGLMPVRAFFDGAPLPDWENFNPEAYRVHFNVSHDRIWFGSDDWHVEESNRLLDFFSSEGIASYGRIYTLEGELLQAGRDPSLIASNGPVALIATHGERNAFIQAVWEMPVPVGEGRYYAGMLQLLSLITLSGRFRVY